MDGAVLGEKNTHPLINFSSPWLYLFTHTKARSSVFNSWKEVFTVLLGTATLINKIWVGGWVGGPSKRCWEMCDFVSMKCSPGQETWTKGSTALLFAPSRSKCHLMPIVLKRAVKMELLHSLKMQPCIYYKCIVVLHGVKVYLTICWGTAGSCVHAVKAASIRKRTNVPGKT